MRLNAPKVARSHAAPQSTHRNRPEVFQGLGEGGLRVWPDVGLYSALFALPRVFLFVRFPRGLITTSLANLPSLHRSAILQEMGI